MVPEVSKYAIRNGRVAAACVSFATAIAKVKAKIIDTKRHGELILLFIEETLWIGERKWKHSKPVGRTGFSLLAGSITALLTIATRKGSLVPLNSHASGTRRFGVREKSIQSWHRRTLCCHHLMTLSARYSTDCGIVRLSAFAVFRLMTNSNFVGCSTGNSAGWAPFRILSTYVAARRHISRRFGP